jgi:hypothetical protein
MIWNGINKTFFLCVISAATITGCTDSPTTAGSTAAPGSSTGTATPYLPTATVAPASAVPPTAAITPASVVAPSAAIAPTATTTRTTAAASPTTVVAATSENYGLYTDSDLQIYADTLDVRIQQALKSNNSSEAQALGVKRQELIREFNRRGLKRHQVEPTPSPRYSRKVEHRRSRVTQPRTKVNPSGAGLPGEE